MKTMSIIINEKLPEKSYNRRDELSIISNKNYKLENEKNIERIMSKDFERER